MGDFGGFLGSVLERKLEFTIASINPFRGD